MSVPPEALQHLPVFPLAGAVLLPGGLLPLHIFEPRYREMTRDALAGHGHIGMVMPLEDELAGAPPPAISDMVGVGRIIANESLSDGRYFIVLRGIGRVRIERELSAAKPYRIVRAQPVRDRVAGDPAQLTESLTTLRALADNVANALPEGGNLLRQAMAAESSPAGLADLVGSTLVGSPSARQTLLETIDVQTRLDILNDHVAALAAELVQPDGVN